MLKHSLTYLEESCFNMSKFIKPIDPHPGDRWMLSKRHKIELPTPNEVDITVSPNNGVTYIKPNDTVQLDGVIHWNK
jgi:hypothetical protein